jgi:hypothetical protein
MNEHPTHDGLASEPDPAELARIELASAYVDGDVDATQRAEVDASAQLMGIVAALRQVRADVAEVPPVDEVARQRAFAAAFAEFDLAAVSAPAVEAVAAAAAPAAVPTIVAPPRVVPFPARNRWSRVLGAAAAVLVVGGIGLMTVNGIGGTDSKSSSGTVAPAQADGSFSVTTIAAGGGATGGATGKTSTEATIGSIGAPASARVEVDTPAQLLTVSDQYASTTSGTASGTGGGTAAGNTAPVTVSTTVPGATTTVAGGPSTTAVRAPGTDTAIAGSAVSPPGSPASRSDRPTLPCTLRPTQQVIALITFKGVDAAAVVDTATGDISAIDAQCHVLATVHR